MNTPAVKQYGKAAVKAVEIQFWKIYWPSEANITTRKFTNSQTLLNPLSLQLNSVLPQTCGGTRGGGGEVKGPPEICLDLPMTP